MNVMHLISPKHEAVMKAQDTYFISRNSIQLQLQRTHTFLPTNSSHSFALQSRLNKLLKTRRHTEFSMRKDLYPFCIIRVLPSLPQTSLTSTKNSKGKTRANTPQLIRRKAERGLLFPEVGVCLEGS
jgi:hypothetical protein